MYWLLLLNFVDSIYIMAAAALTITPSQEQYLEQVDG